MAVHSDYQIRWKNFRAFEDTDWIDVRPLTILIGPNNAGKTSVISPLLLLDQTISSRDALTPLVTRGPLVDAGSFKNIVHNRDTSKELFFGLRYHLHEEKGKLATVGEYPPGGIEITLTAGDEPEDIVLRRFELFDNRKRPFLCQARNAAGKYKLTSAAVKKLTAKEISAIETTKPLNFLFSPSAAMRTLERSREKRGERTSFKTPSQGFLTYFAALSVAFGELTDLFRTLSYIGPLREPPKRYYPIASEMPLSVGSRGEHMANLLRRRLPNLKKELNNWIRKFEFGTGLVVENLSDEVFRLLFLSQTGKNNTNIADAGFGASQVLPLIVQALTAPVQSLTIAEQPEIHLNPRLQYLLADLFVEMANADRRVIVETHSEHLLLRLRRLVATGTIDSAKVAIYFVERQGTASTIRSIPLGKNGHVSSQSWPEGFFEDSLRESLALAAAQLPETHPRSSARDGVKNA